jgi:thiamine biosynthesis lipoprotein
MRDGQMVGRHVEHVMGTVFSLDVRDPVPLAAVDGVVEWLHWVDATFSTYREGSEICRLDRGELTLEECCDEVVDVLARCAMLERRSGGAFSAHATGHLDPSGLVKGWSVEVAAAMLTDAGSSRHAVNGGGDVRVVGRPEPGRAWQIGVADPLTPGGLATVVSVVDGAVATSGTAERGLHVVDPATGATARELASVTVVGPDLGLADAYATAAMVKGRDARPWLEEQNGFEAFAVTADGLRWRTSGFDRWAAPFTANSQADHSPTPAWWATIPS